MGTTGSMLRVALACALVASALSAPTWTQQLANMQQLSTSCDAQGAIVAFDWRCGVDSSAGTWSSIGSTSGLSLTTSSLTYSSTEGFLFNNVYKSVSQDISPSVYSSVSIEVWFKVVSKLNDRGWIVGTDNGGYDRAINIFDNRFSGVASPQGSAYTSTLGYPDIGDWYHCVSTMQNGNSASTVYLQKVDGSMASQTHTPNNGNGLSSFSIGGLQSYTGHTVNAYIPIVRIWNKMLTSSEVTALYNADAANFGAATTAPTAAPTAIPTLVPTNTPTATPTVAPSSEALNCHCSNCNGHYKKNDHVLMNAATCGSECEADATCKFSLHDSSSSKCWFYSATKSYTKRSESSQYTCYHK